MWEQNIREMAHVVYRGRQCDLDGGWALLWPLSGVDITLRCREMYVELEEKGTGQASWFAVWVDGAPVCRFPVMQGRHWYPVLLGMDETVQHRITLVNESQPISGDDKCLVLHAVRSDGEVLPADKAQYQIEFIGDSLTTAEGCAGPRSAAEWKTAWMSPSFSYAKLVGDHLSACVHLISQSGWGVYSDYANIRERRLPLIYEKNCAFMGDEAYDFSLPMDAVVLNLGTNDQSAVEILPEAERPARVENIVEAAVAFLRMIRSHYPNAYILWTYGMCGGELGPHLERAVQLVRKAGDLRVGYVQLPACTDEETGSLWHPGVKNHEQAARVITEHLSRALKRSPECIEK